MKKLLHYFLVLFLIIQTSTIMSQTKPQGYFATQKPTFNVNDWDPPTMPEPGLLMQTKNEKDFSFALESKDPAHQIPHPISNIIFFDGFDTDKGWTGYETGFWERGVAKADEEWNYLNFDSPMPENDFSASADSMILAYNIGACNIPGIDIPLKTITSPSIDCLWDDHVYLSLRSFSSYISSSYRIEVFDGYNWFLIWDKFMILDYCSFSNYSDTRWVYQEFDVSEYAANNEAFKIRFMFYPTNWSNLPGINIDDITVFTPELQDIGIINISPYFDLAMEENFTPAVRVQNFGLTEINSFEAICTIYNQNNQEVYNDVHSYSGALQAAEDMAISFAEVNLNQQGLYTVNVEIILENDNILENNTASESFFLNAHTFWSDNFSSDKDWTNYNPDYWERGEAIRTEGTSLSIINWFSPAYDLTQNGDNILMADNIGNTVSNAINPHYVYSPEIDCSDKTNVKLGFATYISLSSLAKLKVEIKQSNGIWAEASWFMYPFYHQIYQSDWTHYTVDISEYADNNPTMMFRINVSSAMSLGNYYGASFDNFSLSSSFDFDLSLTNIMPKASFTEYQTYLMASIENNGVNTIDEFSVEFIIYDIEDNIVFQGSEDFDQNILSGETYNAKLLDYWTPETPGYYTIKATVSNASDEYPMNDTLITEIVIAESNYGESKIYTYLATGDEAQYTAVLDMECGNSQMTLLKKQYDFSSDFFSEADFIDGKLFAYRAFTQTLYIVFPDGRTFEYMHIPGLENGLIGFGYNEVDQKIYYLAIGETTYKLYKQALGDENLELVMNIQPDYEFSSMAINSAGSIYATANNTSANGSLLKIDYQNNEVQFINTFKVKLKYAQGLGFDRQTDLLYGTLFEESDTGDNPYLARAYQIDTTNAALYPLSDYFSGHEQTSYCAVQGNNLNYPVSFLITELDVPVYGNSVFINNQTYTTNINGQVTVPLKSGIYSYMVSSSCGENTSDVLCFYNQQPNDIIIDFDCITNINEPQNKTISIYPNPTNGLLFIEANKDDMIIVYNNQGQLILTKKLQHNTDVIDLSNYVKGIYIIKVSSKNNEIIKKIIIN